MTINFEPLFWILEELKGIEQKKIFHPEKDVFTHSLQVLNWAFRESNDIDLILAAMLHDVGKVGGSIGHAKRGVTLISCYCSEKTLWLIEHHLRFWDLITGEMKRRDKVWYLFHHKWFVELSMLARWDKAGRNPNVIPSYDKEKIMDRINNLTQS